MGRLENRARFWALGPMLMGDLRTGAPTPAKRVNWLIKKKRDHLGGRRGQDQVFALNQEFST